MKNLLVIFLTSNQLQFKYTTPWTNADIENITKRHQIVSLNTVKDQVEALHGGGKAI